MKMKTIRLELPLYQGAYRNAYLKVMGDSTKAFKDAGCTQLIAQEEHRLCKSMEVPEKLETIEVLPPNGELPIDATIMDWIFLSWEEIGVKRVIMISESLQLVWEGKPNVEELKEKEQWVYEPWILVVYVTENKTFGILRWNARLSQKLYDEK